MSWLSRRSSKHRKHAPVPAHAPAPAAKDVREDVLRRLRERLAELAVPCVRVDVDPDSSDDADGLDDADGVHGSGASAGSADSCFGAGLYLPQGSSWPCDDSGPMCFVAQINFAQAPPLDGYPDRGLLQWFTSSDDCYGLTFDETQGTCGFVVRWFDDVSGPSVGVEPDDLDTDLSPVGSGRLMLSAGVSLPAWDELPEEVQAEPLWQEMTDVIGSKTLAGLGYDIYPEDVWADLVRGYESPLDGLVVGSKIGGFAGFTQADPRGDGAYPSASEPGGRVLLQLDSAETGGWGDGGIGHLFGDPAAMARGDLSSVRYNWDCG